MLTRKQWELGIGSSGSLFAVCCLLFVVFLFVVCCLFFVVCCLLFGVCLLGLMVFVPQLVLFLFSPAPSHAAVFTGIITHCCFHWHYHPLLFSLALSQGGERAGNNESHHAGWGVRVWGLGFGV
jgi:hypothetical protein